MKTSIAGIACFAWLIILSLSQRGNAQFLFDSCKFPTQTQGGKWMVILYSETYIPCAGSLIHSQFVLTVAECFEGQKQLTARFVDKSEVPVKEAHLHYLYSKESGLNNIGLAMLSHPVQYTNQVRPICILRTAPHDVHDRITIFQTYGLGIGTGRQRTNHLAQINIKKHKSIYCDIERNQPYFCGGPVIGNACGGDFGAPLSIDILFSDQQVHPVQFGIESSGRPKCLGARPYTNVTNYADWIEKTVQRALNQRSESPATENLYLYSNCGQFYLTATIMGPNFIAKGVMITHRFVLTTATNFAEDVSSLRVGVWGSRAYVELGIDSVYVPKTGLNLVLLKLASELIPEDTMKPICILRRPSAEQSLYPQFAVLDINGREPLRTTFELPITYDNRICSDNVKIQLEPSDICIQSPPYKNYLGSVVSQEITVPGKNNLIHPLFGIVKYSERGINVITDISSHTNWIASILENHSV